MAESILFCIYTKILEMQQVIPLSFALWKDFFSMYFNNQAINMQ